MNSPSDKPGPRQVLVFKTLLHAGFFASGIATVLIGQVLPILAARFSLNDQQSGNFFPAQFAGSLIGTFLTNRFGKRHRFLAATYLGCFAMAGGLLLLNLGSFELCLLGFLVNGIGIGLTLPSINMLILELSPNRAATALSVLNFFWGFGAILSKPFIDTFGSGLSILLPTSVLAAVLASIGILLLLSPGGIEPRPSESVGDESEAQPIWTNPVAWMIAGFNFVHVGFESAIGGWLATYTQRVAQGEPVAFQPIVIYFVFFVIGRGTAPVFFRFLDENKMLALCLVVVLAGMIVILGAGTVAMLGVGAAIAGFGTAAVFPTNMSRFTQTFGPTASRRAMPFFICGTLGAAFTTWFIGYMSNAYNDLRTGMFILLGSVIVLLVLQSALQLRQRAA